MFERVWTVRFSDTDPFGIAHYPRIVDTIHETSDMYMEEIGYPFWELSQEHEIGLPLVEIDFEFENPMEAGEDVIIELSANPGDRSVEFEYVGRKSDDVVAFSGAEQRVCAKRDGSGATEIPPELRAALEAGPED